MAMCYSYLDSMLWLGSQSMPTFFLDASKGTIGHWLGVFVHVRENFAEWNVV